MKFFSAIAVALVASSAAAIAIESPDTDAVAAPSFADLAAQSADADASDRFAEPESEDAEAAKGRLPACVSNCANQVAPQVGCKPKDNKCKCKKRAQLKNKIGPCILKKCSTKQIQQAEQVQKAAGPKACIF